MAADASGIVSRLERNYTQTLDPVGCRLAVEGRLVSEDAGVLSEKLRRSSLTDESSRAGSNAFEAAAAHAFDAVPHSPPAGDAPQHPGVQNGRRLSSSPMPDSAFSQASQLPASAVLDGPCSCGDGSTCPSTCGCTCHNMAPWDSRHVASSGASGLVMQDTLVDPLTGAGQPLRASLSISHGPSPMDSLNLEQVASLSLLTDNSSSASDSVPPPRSSKLNSPSRLAVSTAPKAAVSGAAASGPASAGASGAAGGSEASGTTSSATAADACACPPYAVKSTCGKRTCMEDAYALCPNICELPLSPCSDEVLADKLPLRIASAFEQTSASMCLSPSHSAPAAAQRPPPTASGDLAAQAYRRQFSHDSYHNAAAAGSSTAESQQQQQQQQQQRQQKQQQQQQGKPGSTLSLPPLPPQSSDHAPPTPPQQPRALQHCTDSNASSDSTAVEKLHFFAVYDGHGGVEASQHCAKRLHHHLSEALVSMLAPLEASDSVHGPSTTGSSVPGVQSNVDQGTEQGTDVSGSAINHFMEAEAAAVLAEEQAKRLRARANSTSARGVRFLPVFGSAEQDDVDGTQEVLPSALADELLEAARQQQQQQQQKGQEQQGAAASAAGSGAAGSGDAAAAAAASSAHGSGAEGAVDMEPAESASSDGSDGSNSSASRSNQLEEALRGAFLKTDEEFAKDGTAGLVGSTAVVSLIGTRRIWVANCGDSRAVLCRGGQAIQVTDDHKPEREDEAERVEKAGGQVLYWNGHRVMGVLAMSRAIGDHCLRPYVIPEPEITVFARHPADELLLMASDGLWDVMPNQEAIDLALRSIKRAQTKGASRKAAARIACTVLTKAALDRGSRDNITVVMIDLASGVVADACRKEGATAAAVPAAAAAAAPAGAAAAAAAAAAVSSGPAAAAGSGAAEAAPAYVSPFGTASGSSSSEQSAPAPAAAAGAASTQQQQAGATQPPPLPPLPQSQQRQRLDGRLPPTLTEPIPASSGAASRAAADAQQQQSLLFRVASAHASSAGAAAASSSGSSSMNRQASSSPFSMHALFPLEGEVAELGVVAGGPGAAGPSGPSVAGLEMAAPAASSNASGDVGDVESFGDIGGPFAVAQLSIGNGAGAGGHVGEQQEAGQGARQQ